MQQVSKGNGKINTKKENQKEVKTSHLEGKERKVEYLKECKRETKKKWY